MATPHARASGRACRSAAALLVILSLASSARAAGSCASSPPPIAAALAAEGGAVSCAHPLCLSFYATDPAHPSRAAAAPTGCSAEALIRRDLEAAVAGGGILVLGEVHDNPVHHRLRAVLLRQLTALPPPSRPGLVLEQLTGDQQPEIEAFEALPPAKRSMEALLGAVSWERSGWSQYPYGPLLAAALDGGYPLVAGDGPRDLVRQAARQGNAAVAPAERARLALATPLGADQDAAMLREIEDSHCGMLPTSAFAGMAFSQRVRDAHLADAALRAAAAHGAAVMLIGNGHARSDRGVPWYVRQREPARRIVAVLLLEVDDARTDPESYLPRSPNGTPAADYVIFTPRAERDDPCAEMRNAMPSRPSR
jgi:uncharacterized iron-regulated protein